MRINIYSLIQHMFLTSGKNYNTEKKIQREKETPFWLKIQYIKLRCNATVLYPFFESAYQN
jgi:hypothetical protein